MQMSRRAHEVGFPAHAGMDPCVDTLITSAART